MQATLSARQTRPGRADGASRCSKEGRRGWSRLSQHVNKCEQSGITASSLSQIRIDRGMRQQTILGVGVCDQRSLLLSCQPEFQRALFQDIKLLWQSLQTAVGLFSPPSCHYVYLSTESSWWQCRSQRGCLHAMSQSLRTQLRFA